MPNVSDDSSDDDRVPDAAAANQGVAVVLSTATAGMTVGGAAAGQGAAGRSAAQLRRRWRPHASATETKGHPTAVCRSSLGPSVASEDRSTCAGGTTDDEWSPFKGA